MEQGLREMLRETVARWFQANETRASVFDRADDAEAKINREHWSEVASLGWLSLGLPDGVGGAELGHADRGVVSEYCGRTLGLSHYFATVVLVGPCVAEDSQAAQRLASGESIFTLAWDEGYAGLIATTQVETVAVAANEGWRLNGKKVRVVGLMECDEVVVSARTDDGVALFIVDAHSPGVTRATQPTGDATRPWGSLTLDEADATLLVGPQQAGSVLRQVDSEVAVALANEAVGLATEILADAAAYTSTRQQFGKAIGSFQAVAGPLADRYVALELAKSMAQWAAIAIDLDLDADVAACAAKAQCAEMALRTTEVAIQVVGAIGFTWEHHYHRYLRRASWIASYGRSTRQCREVVAATLLDERRAPKTVELLDEEAISDYRNWVRGWIEENMPTGARGLDLVSPLEEYERIKGEWRRAMNETGALVAHWPTSVGGGDAPPLHTAIFREEAIKAHPRVSHGDGGSDLVAPLLLEYGTPTQRERYLDGIRQETEIWAQGFSEPNSGSDLASLTTRATRVGDEWVLNGQKIWSTYAPVAQYLFILARTDSEASRHRGISCFIVDAHAPGVEVRPIRDIAGTEEFGEIFLTDVRVGSESLLGPENDGWSVAVMTLAIERVIESCEDIGELDFVLDRLVDCLSDWCDEAESLRTSGEVRQRVAQLWCEVQAVRLVQYHCLLALETSPVPPPESEILKLAWSEIAQQVNRLALEAFGPLDGQSPQATQVARFWEFWYLMSRSVTIYAGTSEILRSVIAERILGLPRSR